MIFSLSSMYMVRTLSITLDSKLSLCWVIPQLYMRVIVFNQGNIMHQSSALFQNSQGHGDGDEKEKRR